MSGYELEDGSGVLLLETAGSYLLEDSPEALVGRVLIALDDTALEPDPTWTRIDDTANLVAGIDIHRGRQTELDQTDTSTATVFLNDTDGLFDPGNTGSPYFDKVDGKPIMLQLRNPFTGNWVTQYRGVIDEVSFDFDPAVNAGGEPLVATVTLECVDLFAYLAGVEFVPGAFGSGGGSVGTVVYAEQNVQTRLQVLLDDAGVPSALYYLFTGNVDVLETKYDPGDSVLTAMRDAADAEFPGIANIYVEKSGRVVFHGRYARLDPATTAASTLGEWTFTVWKSGDGAAIAGDSNRAQIRPPLRWSRPRSRVINSAIAYPRGMDETDMAGQAVTDAPSIAEFNIHSWSATDLLTKEGNTTGNTGAEECALFALYYVANFSQPLTRVDNLTFKSVRPDDPRAEKTWNLLCNAEISDQVDIEHGYPGGVGISGVWFIEGSEMSIRPLNSEYDMVELALNVSPPPTVDVFA